MALTSGHIQTLYLRKRNIVKALRIVSAVLLIGTLLLATGCGHPWFKSRFPWEEQRDPDQPPVIVNSAGEPYLPGTPSWVPLIDDCMAGGGSRGECIEALPPEELAKLEAWEAERADLRRTQMKARQQ
jgi:hypothetical protein